MDEIINRLKKVRRGAMFIIEAPSGTGKSAVVKEILKRDSNIKFSVSVTTNMTSFWHRTLFMSMSNRSTATVTALCGRKWTALSTSART